MKIEELEASFLGILSLESILYQTGYLTISNIIDTKDSSYKLKFPNNQTKFGLLYLIKSLNKFIFLYLSAQFEYCVNSFSIYLFEKQKLNRKAVTIKKTIR